MWEVSALQPWHPAETRNVLLHLLKALRNLTRTADHDCRGTDLVLLLRQKRVRSVQKRGRSVFGPGMHSQTKLAFYSCARSESKACKSEAEVHLARECIPGQNSLFCSCARSESKACKSELKVHLARKLIPDEIHFRKKRCESVQKRTQSALEFCSKILLCAQVQESVHKREPACKNA